MRSPLIVLRGQAALWARTLVVLLAAAPVARAQASDAPSPSSPRQAVALLEWCWENRDAARYRELFTADYRFVTHEDPDSLWTRDEELNAATALFGAGAPGQAGATSIQLEFEGNPQPGTTFLPGKRYPWHQQILVTGLSLGVDRSDGSTLGAGGRTLFYLVRGDSANIPQELRDRGFVPDSSRWYVERWEDVPDSELVVDRAPVVIVSPSVGSVSVGTLLTIEMQAVDPDEEPIGSLSHPVVSGATFIRSSDNRYGWFSWTPRLQDIGTRRFTFSASNRLTTAAYSTITVTQGVNGPTATLVATPAAGNPPLNVRLDASGSRDPDGTIVQYQFLFGDGRSIIQTSPIADHLYEQGTFNAVVVITDNSGLIGRAETVVNVNRRPVVHMTVTPRSGAAPLLVQFDASQSQDDGTIVRYIMKYGDGSPPDTNATGMFTHTYAQGSWVAQLEALDNGGLTGLSYNETITATGDHPPAPPPPNLARNPSFEVEGGWNSYAGAFLERVVGQGHEGNVGLRITGPSVINGSFGVNDSPDQVRWTLGPGIRYRYTAWVRSPSSHGTARIKIREYLIATGAKLGESQSAGVVLSPEWQMLTLDYVTTAANSTVDFQVRDWPVVGSEVFFTDDIRIMNVTTPGAGTGMASWYHGEDPIAMQPRLVPSPIRHAGTLSFMTSESGPLRVEILDLAGRRMRRLMDEHDAPAGMYELAIGPRGDGARLQAGVYFYRIEAREGARSGRFVILP